MCIECVSVSMCVRVSFCLSACVRASLHPIITALVLFPNSSVVFPSHLKVRPARSQYWLEARSLAWCSGCSGAWNFRVSRLEAMSAPCLLSSSPSLNPSRRLPSIGLQATCGAWRHAVLWFCVCSATLLCHSLSAFLISVIVFILQVLPRSITIFSFQKPHMINIQSLWFFHFFIPLVSSLQSVFCQTHISCRRFQNPLWHGNLSRVLLIGKSRLGLFHRRTELKNTRFETAFPRS